MDSKAETIDTYNKSALGLAKKFDGLGARTSDIEETFALIPKENPTVLEIGCGNGRDAEYIVKLTHNYVGIDVAEKLIELARQKVPEGKFIVADVEEYTFPNNLDAMFAFASLIHVPRESLRSIFRAALTSLNTRGVFRLSMKYAEAYNEITKTDEFGTRTYYLYSDKDIAELAEGFTILKTEISGFQNQKWVEVLLQKN